ncbi:uncharacterized protein LOC113216585 [Frankliniella occidentalis]|uniref:Uncharacterized protein LOC113216585 n=1 Tax=Frankliniella occidentalis TaxID=133901 RepID=A0A6J1TH95_FRAOC|nr:uncharacterized protein LOC113216585 [Frankliniella occidentalis]
MQLLLWGGWCALLLAGLGRARAQPTRYVGRKLSDVAGPFRTVVERFEACPARHGQGAAPGWQQQLAEEAVVVNVTRVSRQWGPRAPPQRLCGNLTLSLPLDDSSSTLLTIDKWSNNEWKRNAFIMRLPALCSALRGLGLLGTSCPAREGVYSFRDLAADWQFVSMPQFYYGTWRAEAVFSQADGARQGCVRFLFKTFPAYPENWPPNEDDAPEDQEDEEEDEAVRLVEIVM